MSGRALNWTSDGRDWPNRAASRFVEADGLRWHVQVMGQGPVLLLLHGTGAATHSWRDLLPRLADCFTVVAPDLPGHAFTTALPAQRISLAGMAQAVALLLRHLQLAPAIAVGHSAGAAIAIQMTLERLVAPTGVISLNGALLPIGGVAGRVFSPMARVLAGSRAAAGLVAWWAGDGATIEHLLAQTGSRIDPHGRAYYRRLAGNACHTHAALAMMAGWDLAALERRLPDLATPLVLVVGTKDGSIPPSDAEKIRRRMPTVAIERMRGLGHLAHEEAPRETAALIMRHATAWGVLPGSGADTRV